MKIIRDIGFAAVIAIGTATAATAATVVDFDDLVGSGTVADGYGGIVWGGEWLYYDSPQNPYTPHSGATRIYTAGNAPSGSFSFANDVSFGGAWVSGVDAFVVSFSMFLNNVLVAVSSDLNPTASPTFLSSGYNGLVDRVVFNTNTGNGFYVVDDVTYSPAAVPVPAAAWLMVTGLGALAAVRRRQQTNA